ncbi:cation-transporting P-type ATPase C [Paucidesulfovibrio gracilis DSM 16080]|uniref:Cation-transporting P-type ATPase C n=1 Tax=Paucidesulfovibrio gracilis DSM 16080 TaxID=1121449 RepID=A0A1T4W1Y9_9BACT|nr:hypothetical protein [Paucidesulfovibrio gracilis]SKA71314.1 cation-transporting P-type ATPase C [Paucidesulfovibrio gracilis DSM 16080]
MSLQIQHSLPERVRIRAPFVRNNAAAAHALEQYAKDIEGIQWIRANTKCATIVVRFNQSMLSAMDVLHLLQQQSRWGTA